MYVNEFIASISYSLHPYWMRISSILPSPFFLILPDATAATPGPPPPAPGPIHFGSVPSSHPSCGTLPRAGTLPRHPGGLGGFSRGGTLPRATSFNRPPSRAAEAPPAVGIPQQNPPTGKEGPLQSEIVDLEIVFMSFEFVSH